MRAYYGWMVPLGAIQLAAIVLLWSGGCSRPADVTPGPKSLAASRPAALTTDALDLATAASRIRDPAKECEDERARLAAAAARLTDSTARIAPGKAEHAATASVAELPPEESHAALPRKSEISPSAMPNRAPPGGANATAGVFAPSHAVYVQRPEPASPWEIEFARGTTTDQLAAAWDAMGIELGILQPTGQMDYLARLADAVPSRRSAPAAAETRPYFFWQSGELEKAEGTLLMKAGFPAGTVALKFVPPKLQSELERLAREYAGDRAERIERTRFRVRSSSDGFQLIVADQWYR